MASTAPDSLMPRRFTAAMIMIAPPTQNQTLCSFTNGTAEPMFSAADVTDTATVRT